MLGSGQGLGFMKQWISKVYGWHDIYSECIMLWCIYFRLKLVDILASKCLFVAYLCSMFFFSAAVRGESDHIADFDDEVQSAWTWFKRSRSRQQQVQRIGSRPHLSGCFYECEPDMTLAVHLQPIFCGSTFETKKNCLVRLPYWYILKLRSCWKNCCVTQFTI